VKRKSEHGMSIVSMLVGLALAGFLIAASSQFFKQNLDIIGIVTTKNDIEELRNHIRIGFNCENTIAAISPACTGTNTVVIKRSNDSILLDTPHTKIGKYYLKSICPNVANEFPVMYKSGTNGNWEPLFRKIPLSCP